MTAEDPSRQDVLIGRPADHVCEILLNRPNRANALSGRLLDQLLGALDDAVGDPDVRVVVLGGQGRGFCGGYDIEPRPDPIEEPALEEEITRLQASLERILRVWGCSKPVIARLHGYCLAGGLELAMACDLVVAATDVRIGFAPVRAQGIPPFMIYPWLMGMRQAKRFLWTGDELDGIKAEALGLVNMAVSPASLEAETMKLAKRIALMDGELLTLSKRAIHRSYEAAGFIESVSVGAEFDARGHFTASARQFAAIAREQGLKAALDWRDGPYRAD